MTPLDQSTSSQDLNTIDLSKMMKMQAQLSPPQEDTKVFLKEYDIEQNEHFVQYVFLPYFKDIFKDLSARSDKPQEGINRLVFLDVSTKLLIQLE